MVASLAPQLMRMCIFSLPHTHHYDLQEKDTTELAHWSHEQEEKQDKIHLA